MFTKTAIESTQPNIPMEIELSVIQKLSQNYALLSFIKRSRNLTVFAEKVCPEVRSSEKFLSFFYRRNSRGYSDLSKRQVPFV